MKKLTQFNFKDKAQGRLNARCKMCTRKGIMAAYYKKRNYYIERAAIRRLKQRRMGARFLRDYLLQHSCVDCHNNNPLVLQFDHVRGAKKLEVGMMAAYGYAINTIIAEIEKCEVRCANCHAIKTARERGYHALLMEKL